MPCQWIKLLVVIRAIVDVLTYGRCAAIANLAIAGFPVARRVIAKFGVRPLMAEAAERGLPLPSHVDVRRCHPAAGRLPWDKKEAGA